MSDFAPTTDHPYDTGAQPAPDPGSFPKRFVDTLFSPVALFQRFNTRAPWVDALIVGTVLMAAFMMIIPRELLEAQIRDAMSQQQAPPGAPAPSMDTMVMFGRIGGVVSQLVGGPLIALLVAGLCTGIFGKLMDGEGSFRKHLAVVSHAGLITPLGFAITLFFAVQSGDMATQLSPALLIPGLEAESFAFRVLNALSVFYVWWLALLTAGVSSVNRRISPAKAGIVIFAIYLAVVVVIAAVRG
ncbi:MAG TPA: YIP1 family protein [Longimicrobium sp.]|nr:YIP1 family protein [Longimicrobium sp.]